MFSLSVKLCRLQTLRNRVKARIEAAFLKFLAVFLKNVPSIKVILIPQPVLAFEMGHFLLISVKF